MVPITSDRKALLSVLDNILSDDDLEILVEAAEMGFARDVYVPSDDEWKDIARGDLKAIQKKVEENRENWMLNFARGLAKNRNLIDQREVDEKRGYWYGAMFYTHVLPRIAARKVAKAAKQKESDA